MTRQAEALSEPRRGVGKGVAVWIDEVGAETERVETQ